MNIEGLGESLVDQLIEQGLVHDFADLYHLDASSSSRALVVAPREPRSERAVPRKLGKVGRNVVEQIERSKTNDLSRLIYALGIRHVGEKAAATLARHFRTMDAAAGCAGRGAAGGAGDRPGRRGVGPRVRRRAAQPGAGREAGGGRRQHATSQAPEPAIERAGPLAGKTFVLTGTLASMSREEATAALEAAGRQGVRIGQQEDELRRGRRRRREQAREGAGARRRDARTEDGVSARL